jgi:hypothetical protein
MLAACSAHGKLRIWPQRDAGGQFFNRVIDTDGHHYRTYGLFGWEPTRQTFYFEGQPYSLDVTMPGRRHILVDLQFGSASGTPDDSFEIEYVRAWKRD